MHKRFWIKVDIKDTNSCWNWLANINNQGYGRFNIDGRLYSSHRVAWEITNGPIPEDMMILHRCDNKLCCNPAHLYCGTQKDNMQDRSIRNRISSQALGAGKAKLYAGEVWLIRKLWKEGNGKITQTFIAKMFKVTISTINKIVHSSTYLCKEGHSV